VQGKHRKEEMNGKKVQYLNYTDAMKAVEQIMMSTNSEDWRVIVQKVGVEYRVQYQQVRKC
jgi:hypothetical protein